MLSGKLDEDRAAEFIGDKVEIIAPPIIEEHIEEQLGELIGCTILKGTVAPTNTNLFWLDTK